MPWCDTCDRLVDEDDLVERHCPTCGTALDEPVHHPVTWRFRLLIVATVIYLIWRFVQGVQWLSHHA
ncbi:MAG TPA: hypothetical protein VGZ03_08950 [Acidimicrobiales bacterium]|nr:hypothetical protein [Acidimicrobiales bacterium]